MRWRCYPQFSGITDKERVLGAPSIRSLYNVLFDRFLGHEIPLPHWRPVDSRIYMVWYGSYLDGNLRISQAARLLAMIVHLKVSSTSRIAGCISREPRYPKVQSKGGGLC